MKQARNVPTGRITRIARLASLGVETGIQLLAKRDAHAAAAATAEVLGSLRGLATKVGQMASYVDGFVPDDYRAAYESALQSLRRTTCPSKSEEIQSVIENELGAPVDRLFVEWAKDPFASASIGQVHRARLADGRVVAVKVQHPGIERAVDSDLRNAGVVESMVGTMLPRGVDTRRLFNDVCARFREELDYLNEANNQQNFQQIHAGDPQIVIPRVVVDRSSRRVLTTELVSGIDLAAAATLTDREREQYSSVLWRFEFKSLLGSGMFNADPHPGNFLFQDNGCIAFLDFGCVQVLDESVRAAAKRMHNAAIRRQESEFRLAAAAMLGTHGGSYERAVLNYVRHSFQPIFASPFRVTPEYVKGVVTGIRALKGELYAKDKSFVMPPRGLAFMNRLQFGFYSVLARLDATVDYAALETQFIE